MEKEDLKNIAEDRIDKKTEVASSRLTARTSGKSNLSVQQHG